MHTQHSNTGFSINMARFVVPSNEAELENGKLKLGLTTKVYMPIFVDCSYSLGYIFGAFLSCGIANLSDYKKSTRGIVMFRPKPDFPGDLDKVNKYIKDTFNVEGSRRKDGLYVYNVAMTRMFKEFGIRKGRHLPSQYHTSHTEFNKGIKEGLDDFGGIVPDERPIAKKRIVSKYILDLYKSISN